MLELQSWKQGESEDIKVLACLLGAEKEIKKENRQ